MTGFVQARVNLDGLEGLGIWAKENTFSMVNIMRLADY
jgi:hypothetical protein